MVSIKILLVLGLMLQVYMCDTVSCTVTISGKITRVKDTTNKKTKDDMCSMCMTLALVSKSCEVVGSASDKDLLKAIKDNKLADFIDVEKSSDFILISNDQSKCAVPEQSNENYVDMAKQIYLAKLKEATGGASFGWKVENGVAFATLRYTWTFRTGYKATVAYQGGMKAAAKSTAWCGLCANDYTEVFVAVAEDTYGSKAAMDAFKKIGEVIWDGTKMVALGVGVLVVGAVIVVASPIILLGVIFDDSEPSYSSHRKKHHLRFLII